jgi:lipopolysaccharide export system permease protein
VLKNESGSYLVLEDGNLERFETGKRDPALVAFARYAFDMSKFSNRGRDVALGIRERYLWELVSPAENDPVFKQLSGQFRAELHDRFLAPVYPFAFSVLTFAFLGTPRTTRQSRNFSIGGSIFAVFGLRMAGFACSVMTVKNPGMALVQYLMLFGSIGIGLWMIIGGIVVEPPAALMVRSVRASAVLLEGRLRCHDCSAQERLVAGR